MNERIRELWEQCKTYDWNQNAPIYTYDHENFAKLIVQECASICYNSQLQDSDAHAQNILFEFDIDGCRNNK